MFLGMFILLNLHEVLTSEFSLILDGVTLLGITIIFLWVNHRSITYEQEQIHK